MAQNLRPPCVNYNTFFHPNLCHVCKSEDMLDPCPQCLMISYCDEEHRLLHREDHKEMCEALQSLSQEKNIRESRNMELQAWIKFKMTNVSYMEKILNRELQKYEVEMIVHAKSCFICFQQDNLIQNCSTCKSINVCFDHKLIYPEHSCQELKLSLDINKYLANRFSEDITLPKNILHLETEILSMKAFNELHLDSIHKDPCWPFGSYIYSEYLSQPLTLYFGVQYTGLICSLQSFCPFVVHIIRGLHNCRNSSLAWEIILHVLPCITSLIIIIIEPELTELYSFVPLCEKCERDNRSLEYRYIFNTYGNYADSPAYIRPNVIIGYHIKFSGSIVSMSDLKAIERACCPLILTYYSYDTMRHNMSKIPLLPIYFQRNDFAGCTPLRSVEDGMVCYHNQYLIIYQDRDSFLEIEAGSSFDP